jgi:hypothetical protein
MAPHAPFSFQPFFHKIPLLVPLRFWGISGTFAEKFFVNFIRDNVEQGSKAILAQKVKDLAAWLHVYFPRPVLL